MALEKRDLFLANQNSTHHSLTDENQGGGTACDVTETGMKEQEVLNNEQKGKDVTGQEVPGEGAALCKFYLLGRCHFGSKCRNLHSNLRRGNVSRKQGEEEEEEEGEGEGGPQKNNQGTKTKMKPLGNENKKGPREKASKKPRMKTAEDVIARILWDPQLRAEEFSVGYLDRFVGVLERPFSEFCWEDLASVDQYETLAVPQHRIQYFKYQDQIVWDKNQRKDLVFGSTGEGRSIGDVMREEEERKRVRERETRQNEEFDGELQKTDELANEEATEDQAEKEGNEKGGKELALRLKVFLSVCLLIITLWSPPLPLSKFFTFTGSDAELENQKVKIQASTFLAQHQPQTIDSDTEHDTDQFKPEPEPQRLGPTPTMPRLRRPNHFAAIRLLEKEFRQASVQIRDCLTRLDSGLAEHFVPVETLHISLCLLKLDTPVDVQRARDALQEFGFNNRRLLPPPLVLSFPHELRDFKSTVLYLQPEPLARLHALARSLERAFKDKGLSVTCPSENLCPKGIKLHATLAKVRKLPKGTEASSQTVQSIPEELYSQAPAADFGCQVVDTLELCSTGSARRCDGFYNTLATVRLH
ncbi:leukocyte receptor cluster member 9 [Polyodon spathula]|uniref:leukocyte receptor cluster member 9 n=1 Tax=Polyodon spathula TaxID=7913 RepID=UPI001B7F6D88|nr:leukocyte receptor cluster member 9 [Polyodon spathula]